GTLAVWNLTVFYDPAFAPVRTNHTILKSCRRCPGGGSFINFKSSDRNITDACFRWHKASTTYIDLYIFLIWILTLEISINNCFISIHILFGIPLIDRFFRYPTAFIDFAFDTLF